MKALRIILSAVALLSAMAAGAQDNGLKERLEGHLYYFAADSLNGRKAASEDARKVAAYIRAEFEQIGLEPYFDDFYEDFERDGATYRNVVAVIPGSNPALSKELIVIGAHYDHLGVKSNGEVFNGADDNASGTSCLIELARMLMQDREKLSRSVVLAAFDGEEVGLYGSSQLAKRMTAEGADVKFMASLDMVGWLKAGKTLKLEGTGTIKDGSRILKEEADKVGIQISTKKFEDSVFTATDTEGFAHRQIPTLAVTTGLKSPYHKTGDDPELIDYEGLALVTRYMDSVVGRLASDPSYAASGVVAPKHTSKEAVWNKLTVEAGLRLGYAGTSIDFRNAAFSCTDGMSFIGGLYAKFNYRYTGLLTGVYYDKGHVSFPDPGDPFEGILKYRQSGLIVPIEGLLQYGNAQSRIFCGLGGWMGSTFEGSGVKGCYNTARLQGGVAVSLGLSLGKISFQLDSFNQVGNLFDRNYMGPATTIAAPKAKGRWSAFTIGWKF